jgi:acyl-CoA synthetase (AMP-forming)/AMP-acid ligase II
VTLFGTPGGAATMAEVLAWRAAEHPDRCAFVFLERGEREAGSLTYAALDRRARLIASELQGSGLAGRRVVLAYPTCLEFVAALFGCFHAGAIAIPAPADGYGRNVARLRSIIDDADAAALLSLRSVLDQGMAIAGEARPSTDIVCIATDELQRHSESTTCPAGPAHLAMLQYTSGSTGNPRGVMLTHGNIISNQHALSAVLASDHHDVVVNWLPLYHDMGLIGGVLHTVYFGGLAALIPPLAFLQKPIRWLRAIGRHRATISMAPAFAYGLLSRQRQAESEPDLDLSSWRLAICGGEPIRPPVLDRFTAAYSARGFNPKALMPAYGLAEATLIATASAAGTGMIDPDAVQSAPPCDIELRTDAWHARLACCGPATAGLRVTIVDPATRIPVPPGNRGEVWLQGRSVAAGYWNRPEETQAVFGARLADAGGTDPWLRTGDLGFMSARGLVITGRAKDIIVIRGENFDPLDLETSAGESDPALEPGGGVACAVEHDDEERVVLLHEVRRDALKALDVDRVAGRVIEKVSRCFGLRLHDLVLLRPRTLPRTTSGKIQRHACKQQYLTRELAALQAVDHPALRRCELGETSPT